MIVGLSVYERLPKILIGSVCVYMYAVVPKLCFYTQACSISLVGFMGADIIGYEYCQFLNHFSLTVHVCSDECTSYTSSLLPYSSPHTHAYTHTHAYIPIHLHTYAHTHTHTHTHTARQKALKRRRGWCIRSLKTPPTRASGSETSASAPTSSRTRS